MTPEEVDRVALEEALAKHRGNVARVARAFGLHRQQIYRLLQEHGLTAAEFRRRKPDA